MRNRKRNIQPKAKKRRFKRYSERNLSLRDLVVLDFLWTWKVATTPMLKAVAYQNKSHWWVYKALRQLKKEKYIQLLPRSKSLTQELWALTELGFEVVLMDRDDLMAYRYKPHAPTHDFFATCLQLGDLWFSSIDKHFFTEQMLASLSSANFPRGFKTVKEHIPDGITQIKTPLNKITIGYEVDINLKEEERYKSTLNYYKDGLKPDLVIWLVRNPWMANRIGDILNNYTNKYDESPLINKTAFVLLGDFKKQIWEAKAISLNFKGISIRKLHTNLLQSKCKSPPKLQQTAMKEIFFPKYKSPQKSITYKKEGGAHSNKHPTG